MSPLATLLRIASVALVFLALASIKAPAPIASYYPLVPGMTWEYEVSSAASPGNPARLTVSNVGRRAVGIWAAAGQRIENGGRSGYRFIIDRPDYVATVGEQRPGEQTPTIVDPPVLLLKLPAHLGQTWKADTTTTAVAPGTKIDVTSKIESVTDRVEVPGGTFENCLRVVSAGSTNVQAEGGEAKILIETKLWYAPGVGVVQIQRKESSDPDLGTAEVSYKLVGHTGV